MTPRDSYYKSAVLAGAAVLLAVWVVVSFFGGKKAARAEKPVSRLDGKGETFKGAFTMSANPNPPILDFVDPKNILVTTAATNISMRSELFPVCAMTNGMWYVRWAPVGWTNIGKGTTNHFVKLSSLDDSGEIEETIDLLLPFDRKTDVQNWDGWTIEPYLITDKPVMGLNEGKPMHYFAVRVANVKGDTYVLKYSYMDEEDGENSYGWVEDDKGKRVGIIHDGDIMRMKK